MRADETETEDGVVLPRPRVGDALGRDPRTTGIGERPALDAREIGLFEEQRAAVRRPPEAARAFELLLGDELGGAVGEIVRAAAGDGMRLRVVDADGEEIVPHQVRDRLSVRRQVRIDRRRFPDGELAPRAGRALDEDEAARERDEHVARVPGQLVAGEAGGDDPHALAPRLLGRREHLAALGDIVGREHQARLAAAHVHLVERLPRIARGAAEEEDGARIRQRADRRGTTEAKPAALGVGAEERGIERRPRAGRCRLRRSALPCARRRLGGHRPRRSRARPCPPWPRRSW